MNITTSPYRPYSAIYKYSQPCLHYFHFFYNILYYTIYVYVLLYTTLCLLANYPILLYNYVLIA